MSIWQLAIREIRHRKLSFVLGLLSVTVAISCLVGAQTLLRADQIITAELLSARKAETEAAIELREAAVTKTGAELEDAMRKHMLGLGFNVLILPEDQSLSELHLDGTLSATMPESYVDKLAQSRIVTVNHLLPSVTKRVRWPEYDRDIILVGTRGEVPILHRGMKKQLLEEVAEGKIVLGYDIHQQLKLSEGDTVTLLGQDFTVTKLHAQRGSTDDVTVWINLGEAQDLLKMENLINAILALECDCAGDRISVIREEIAGILPGTQVIERYSQALARAEARGKAKQAADVALQQEREAGEQALQRERSDRQALEASHARFAGLLVPLVIFGAAVLIALLAFANARHRSDEIGILRAIGLKARQIMLLFLSRAALIGIAGGILGTVLGLAVSVPFSGLPAETSAWYQLTASNEPLMLLAAAPFMALLLSGIASWVPALIAARQDPAVVLQEGTH